MEHDVIYATPINVEHTETEIVIATDGQRVTFHPMEIVAMGARWVEYAVDKGWRFENSHGEVIPKVGQIDQWISALTKQRERLVK
jgi:hypothetical protein